LAGPLQALGQILVRAPPVAVDAERQAVLALIAATTLVD
jgi:hypothetical protein